MSVASRTKTSKAKRTKRAEPLVVKRAEPLVAVKTKKTKNAIEEGVFEWKRERPSKTRMAQFTMLSKMYGREKALELFQQKWRAPFGRRRAFEYSWDRSTGILKYAGAVWSATEPMQHESKVVRVFASLRFNNSSDVITLHDQFDVPNTKRDIEKAIYVLSSEYGVSSKNKNYQSYRNELKRIERRASVVIPKSVTLPSKRLVKSVSSKTTKKKPTRNVQNKK